MKKIFLIGLPTILLFSCGSEEASNTKVKDVSGSLVMNYSPKPSETNKSNFTQSKEVKTDTPINISNVATTSIEFFESEHAFGNVLYPSENMYTFKFKNTGNSPLVIESAKASCGCTIPNKPEEPILPGKIGEIDVIFRPKEGQKGTLVNKRVTVVANTEPKQTYININANVLQDMGK